MWGMGRERIGMEWELGIVVFDVSCYDVICTRNIPYVSVMS